MPLSAGTTLGPYAVTAKIGEGGMGEVYRARDTKLDRDVALKVLPQAFTDDPDRLARFEREAKVLASLNHPNIGHIYGLEEAEGTKALVLELIEGPTLADRIKQGPIPLDEALPIAKQIAEALEAAHEAGVIHRDLKPANIKVREDGTVKVLDFGLAKALNTAPPGDPSQSPTLTAAATQMGVIMGTVAYMSPEQARGKPVDKRADVWAFGAVLFEMLSGRRAFGGEDFSLTLSAVLQRQPDWDMLLPGTPAEIRRLLIHSLTKEPRDRLHHIADARIVLREVAIVPSDFAAVPLPDDHPTVGDISTATQVRPGWVAVGSAFAAGIVVALGVGMLTSRDSVPTQQPLRRIGITLPDDLPMRLQVGTVRQRGLALSPSGQTLAYIATTNGGPVLAIRPLDSADVEMVRGSEGAHTVFFSPDGRWVGFGSGELRKLMKVSVDGTQLQEVCDLPLGYTLGGAWSEDGFIYFSTLDAVMRVSEDGGTPEELSLIDADGGEVWRGYPDPLPSGGLLFHAGQSSRAIDGVTLLGLSAGSGNPRSITQRSLLSRYLPTGHLLLPQAGRLMAAPFDPATLDLLGPPFDVTQPGMLDPSEEERTVPLMFAVSNTGTLVYPIAEGQQGDSFSVAIVDRAGGLESLPLPSVPTGDWARLSPDGRRVVAGHVNAGQRNIWVHDLDRGISSQVTFGASPDRFPIFAPDGRRVLYTDASGLVWSSADGGDEPSALWPGALHFAFDFSPGRETVFMTENSPDTGYDIWAMDPNDPESTRRVLGSAFDEEAPKPSPDGRWLAYHSDETGTTEVFVRSLQGLENRWRVSLEGGKAPEWAPRGDEIFFMKDGGLYAAPVLVDGERFETGPPTLLFEDPIYDYTYPFFDVFPDGQRFLMLGLRGQASTTHLAVVDNWFDEIERLASVN